MYAGNSSVINFLMRWPVLIPVAAAAVVVPAVQEEAPAPVPVVQKVEQPVVVPVPPVVTPPVVVPTPPRKVEELCPPLQDTAKLKRAEKDALKARGCKVAG